MARPKAFEPHEALHQAMELFWERGYAATSIADLQERTGLSRASIYGTFGSKDELYSRALERYRDQETSRAVGCLDGDGDVRIRVRRLFETLVHDGLVDPANRGCMILNAAMERPHDRATARQVKVALRAVEDALRALLTEARDRGELDAGTDVRELARFLTTSLQGIRLMAKATRDRELLGASIDVAVRAID